MLVSRARKSGDPVYYGNVIQSGLLRSLGAGGAQIIVVTLNDPEATTRLVSTLKQQYPDVAILARGHNLEICQELARLGSAGVVSENVEASLELSRMAMELMAAQMPSVKKFSTVFGVIIMARFTSLLPTTPRHDSKLEY